NGGSCATTIDVALCEPCGKTCRGILHTFAPTNALKARGAARTGVVLRTESGPPVLRAAFLRSERDVQGRRASSVAIGVDNTQHFVRSTKYLERSALTVVLNTSC